MNTYIQNKLDAFDKEYRIDEVGEYSERITPNSRKREPIRKLLEQSLTDYHNHIVEKIEEYADSQSDETVAMGIIGTISLLKD
jgi:hypothetical protein